MTQLLGWPAIFAINVPIGAVVIVLALRVIPADARIAQPRHFDATGALLVTAGLVSLTYGIVRTDTLGWGSPGVLVPLAVAAVLIAGFLFVERRVASAPLVPLVDLPPGAAAHGEHRRRAACTRRCSSMFFFVTLYLQQVLGDDALEAGLVVPAADALGVHRLDARAAAGRAGSASAAR